MYHNVSIPLARLSSSSKYQDTQSCISSQEVVWHTSMLFTGTTKLPFPTRCISVTTGLISVKLAYCGPSIHVHDFTYPI